MALQTFAPLIDWSMILALGWPAISSGATSETGSKLPNAISTVVLGARRRESFWQF